VYKLTSVAKLYHKGRRTGPAVQDLTLTISDGQWLAVQGRTGPPKVSRSTMAAAGPGGR
jgi:putative ABC transport system ATP-binding protein